MPSLTRQQTLESLRSWWSDSNPPGPTINLHAAAKPLMRLMYHRQAMEFVRKNRYAPLSPESLGIYADYVAYKYVSSLTNTVILKELGRRVVYQRDASVVLASAILNDILQLLQSPDFDIRSQTGIILRNLARHESCAGVIGESLVAQLRDNNVGTLTSTSGLFALTRITESPNGAAAAVKAEALHLVAKLLESPIPAVRKHACEVLGNLAWHRSTAEAVLDTDPCGRLVGLLRDGFVFEAALGALIRIAHWPGGAEAAVAAKVLDNCAEWLGSPADWVRRSAVRLLGKLAKHEGTTGAVLQIAPCEQLVTLLSDSDYSLVANAAFDVLSSIANTADGAQAAVAAKVLKHVTHRLISSVPQIRVSACELLVKLARHQSTAAAVLDIKPCERLVALLIDGDVAAEAFHALCSIANSRDGAEAVVEAKVRDHLAEGVVSHVPDIQGAAWTLLRRLQAHESTAAAVLAITPCERLVTLLSDSDGWVVIDAFGRLSDIAKSPEGAEATVTAKALDQVVEHLVSPVSVVRAPATELLLRLAGHSSTIQEVVRVYPNVVSLVKYRKHLLGTQDTINDMARHPGHRWGEVGERAMWALDDYLARSQAGINLGAN